MEDIKRQGTGFFQSDPSLADLVVKEISYHQTIQGFCGKVFSSLRAWNRTRVFKSPAGLASFLALTLQPSEMKNKGKEETEETETDEGEEVIELDLTVKNLREYETDVSERERDSSDD